ncbi:MAG: LysR family transcriptional regulator [Gammaproteobacteria bacterium]
MPRHATFRQLEIFLLVAKHLSLTRASELLFLSQPAVSMQIKQLENLVGMSLFEKTGKKLYLTEAGKVMRDHARDILSSQRSFEETIAKLAGAESGYFTLAVPETAIQFATFLLAQFCRQHPGIGFHLEIHNRAGLLTCIKENTTDLTIMGQTPAEMELVTKVFMKNPLVIIASPEHPLSVKKRISLAELLPYQFVVRERGSGTRIAMQRFCSEHGIQLKTAMEMPNNEAIKQAVAAGFGLGIISLHTLQQELALKKIKILPVEKLPITRFWHIVHHKQKILSPAMVLFKEFVIQNTQQIWCSKYPELLHFL